MCLALTAATSAAADRAPIVASTRDAFIAHQSGSDVWSIGSAQLDVSIGLDPARTLTLQRMTNPATGRSWEITPGADFGLTVNGERLTLGATGSLTFLNATAQATPFGVQLTFRFESRSPRLQISRFYSCYAGSPTIETWTRVTSAGDTADVTDLVGWQLTMPLAHVRLLTGLRGDAADTEQASAFELADHDLEPGERLEIRADGRSTEQFVPFVLVDDGQDTFYGGMIWSGSWRIALERAGDRLRVGASFPAISTSITPSRPLEVPHTFFGLTAHSVTAESGALRPFIMNGIRRGRPFVPLVTYNTWFPYGIRFDEDTIVAEMDRAASLGAELFVLDAGWWSGADATTDYDFESGLGTWTVDADRFPSGLASLADYAHGVGMKFGLWVEPERVALGRVDKPGFARETWVATRDGDHAGGALGQICFAKPEARQWVTDRLVALIDEVRPDYLKWDNNFWINCDRSGHGHGKGDGNLAHVQALYDVLNDLRTRYPDLLIENVSGGGNRLDFGMLAYTDVAWMDDRTSPGAHVRHNLEGLIVAFPPAYLLSFFIDSGEEPIHGADDLASIVRSRMPGVLGLTYRSQDLDDDIAAALTSEIERYKRYRGTLATAHAMLLSAQAPVDESSWDVLQHVADDRRSALIFAFKATPDEGRLIVRPRNLEPGATYAVLSVDAGPIGEETGATLMADGIELMHSALSASRAHMLVLTVTK